MALRQAEAVGLCLLAKQNQRDDQGPPGLVFGARLMKQKEAKSLIVQEWDRDDGLDVNLADEGEKVAMEALASKPLPPGVTTRSLFMEMAQAQYQRFMPTLSPDRRC